jgi:hypothetical protein
MPKASPQLKPIYACHEHGKAAITTRRERRQCARSPCPSARLSVTADRAGHAEQSHPPAARLPVPHRLTPPRRSWARPPVGVKVGWMIPGWRPSLSPGPSRSPGTRSSRSPSLEPRRHPGILAGLPLTPRAVNRDQLHCQECPARAACMTDEDASATAIQEDPVRGICGHSQCRTAMHKYAGRRAHVELAGARRPGEVSASNRRSVRTARARARKAGTIIPWRRGER